MLRLIYLSAIILFASCATPRKLDRLMDKLPAETSKQCSERFPIKETIDTFIVADAMLMEAYQNEYNRLNIVIDSLLNKGCDTVVIDSIKTIIKQLPAKTNTKVITRIQENTAKIQATQDACDILVKQLIKVNENNSEIINNLIKKNTNLRKRNIWLWLLIIGCTIWIFRKAIFALVK